MRKAIFAGIFLAFFLFGCDGGNSGDSGPLLGGQAPDFSIPALSGGTASLASQKGKVVLLDFWATWCAPCLLSLPHVQNLSADSQLHDRGLVVWALNQGEDNKKVQDFIDQNHYSFTVLMDEGSVESKYHIVGLPTTVIIGRDGKVRNVLVAPLEKPADREAFFKQVDDAIKQALDEPAPKSPA